ncbi:MAG: 1-deoxy-D-xylulose-5-phosphate reductoisomerase [Candidatus Cloacimonetes bacterium]|nr:1-deoxy-D-xylulose-5-phosphate reductoisomerase [Candidatus Cloacimonadota bacterium]
MKKIAILGITGSIGLSAVEVIREHKNDFKIVLASANNGYQKLLSLAEEFNILNLNVTNASLKNKITDFPKNTNITFGDDKLQELLSTIECDIVLNAISGSAGLLSSMTAISCGIDLALANKESLVMAGHLIMEKINNSNSKLIPVDSEHSAILQAIGKSNLDEVRKIILTASGGPFRTLPVNEFEKITVEQSLNHPTWKMGPKITIDSATMMNKGLEVIEAKWLFKKDISDIETVIHPQSIVHSFVEFIDGSIVAQMSFPTMKIPILYALSYPVHINSNIFKTNITDLPSLTFSEVDQERYPLFFLAKEVGKMGGLMPAIMNAANEAAIDLFLEKKIRFDQIFKIVQYIIQKEKNIQNPEIKDIISANREIYKRTLQDYLNIF